MNIMNTVIRSESAGARKNIFSSEQEQKIKKAPPNRTI
jgi:hypothetical protein